MDIQLTDCDCLWYIQQRWYLKHQTFEFFENKSAKWFSLWSQEVGLSVGTCHKIVEKTLNLLPHKLRAHHELLLLDFNRLIAYCRWFLEHLNDDNLLNLTFFSSEPWFHHSGTEFVSIWITIMRVCFVGYVNSQNMRCWSAESPLVFRETPLHHVQIMLKYGAQCLADVSLDPNSLRKL